jgi:hypothetical protein
MNVVSTYAAMVREAEQHADDKSKDRLRAVQYYQGEMIDTPSDKGRSSIVSRDVRAVIKKVLPSIVRTILGSDQVVEFQPVAENDEEGAAQATDFINHVTMPECDGRKVIEDALHDALLLRNGILKWWWSDKKVAHVSDHSGLSEEAMAQLLGEDGVEVLNHTERVELVENQPMPVHDLRIKRITVESRVMAAAVPMERFLIHPDAVSLEDAALCGEKTQLRRSDLIAMGYDREVVDGLGKGEDDDSIEQDERRDHVSDAEEVHRPIDLIDYYDLYIRFDADEDGIAELRHVCFAGGLGENNLLMDEDADEVQFCDVKVMRQPHQWEGISLFDDTADIQRVKTVLLRQTLDNIYWQNNPQPIMQSGKIKNPDAVYNPEFGKPIIVAEGVDVRMALGFNSVPFVAKDSFAMLEYMDGEAEDRTGITDASGGLAPDALQNVTAKASAMMEQAGIGQAEMMVRTAADGLRRFFLGLLKTIIRHQDKPRTVRLRDKWVEFDPRQWNAMMDCSVNVGLGAGTRERDMQVMQGILAVQERIAATLGPKNPFVKPENLYNTLSKMVQAAGLQTPGMYFTEPDANAPPEPDPPSPEMMKVQAEAEATKAKLQLEQQKAQADAQLGVQKAQADVQLTRERGQADIEVARQKAAAEMQLSRERMQAEFQLKREQMTLEAELKREQNAMMASVAKSDGISGVRPGGAVG